MSKSYHLLVLITGLLTFAGGCGTYLNANGEQTGKDVWGKRARRVRLPGQKDSG